MEKIIEYGTDVRQEGIVCLWVIATMLTIRMAVIGAVETDPEYMLIVDANNLILDIDNEIGLLRHTMVTALDSCHSKKV